MRISEYFAGKSAFVTGGTGFLGKGLIEKLLRSCPDLETIYVLIRERKGKTAQERLDKIKENLLFDVLKKSNPDALNKLVAIKGDVSELKSIVIRHALFHMIPAIFLDAILMLAGRKPMLIKLQRKIFIANSILYPFISQTWYFVNHNILDLNDTLPLEDREDFGAEIYKNPTDEQVYQFFRQSKVASALYLFKEQYDLDLNRKLMRRRWLLDIAVKTLLGLVICWYLFKKLNVAQVVDRYIQDYFV